VLKHVNDKTESILENYTVVILQATGFVLIARDRAHLSEIFLNLTSNIARVSIVRCNVC
jgi:hypothetical protein